MSTRVAGWNNVIDTLLPALLDLGTDQGLGGVLDAIDARIDSLTSIFTAHNGLAYDHANSSGLTFAYKGGVIDDGTGTPVTVAAGTIALTAASTNYIMVNPAGTVSKSTSGWEAGKRPMAIVVAGASSFSMGDVTDKRAVIGNPADSAITGAKLESDIKTRIGTVGFTIGAESSNAITVTIQLKDSEGSNVSEVRLVDIWLADAANGGLCSAAPDGGWSVGTGTVLETMTANKYARILSNSSGVIAITITHAAGAKTLYAAVLQSGDKVTYSGAITFA